MYVCVCGAKKTSVLESYKIQSIDGCSWEAVVGQAHDCVGGPEGHLGPYKHSVVLGPAVKPVFWLIFMVFVPRSGFLALVF